ncbi:MAG: phospholipase, partial [Bacteroidales bacterium]|nr:phospholipase [Bacteroidales bacterium]
MEILLLILLGLTLVAFILGFVRNAILKRKVAGGQLEVVPTPIYAADADCCGVHDSCDKERVLKAFAE